MGIENGDNSQQEAMEDQLRNTRLRFIKYKLDHDIFNTWMDTMIICIASNEQTPQRLKPTLSDETWNRLKERLRYEEEIQSRRLPGDIELVMELSDPTTVAAYDKLVDEFNSDLERIKKTKDATAVRDFYLRAKELIYSEK
ncbi:MAG: hypothetical protein QG609_575 [Patescibacteria group bacterium]|jgi:hypothetical protein|nr:hypothetical protein [Patescibacteria group bacterium]